MRRISHPPAARPLSVTLLLPFVVEQATPSVRTSNVNLIHTLLDAPCLASLCLPQEFQLLLSFGSSAVYDSLAHIEHPTLSKLFNDFFCLFNAHLPQHLIDSIQASTFQCALEAWRECVENGTGLPLDFLCRVCLRNVEMDLCTRFDCLQLYLLDLIRMRVCSALCCELCRSCTDSGICCANIVQEDFLSLMTWCGNSVPSLVEAQHCIQGSTYLLKNKPTPSLPSARQYCRRSAWCTHCFAKPA